MAEKRGRGRPRAAPQMVKVKALTTISGLDFAALRGGFCLMPVPEAERYVAEGFAEFALEPVEAAVKLLMERGCGVALPENPDEEVQAAVTSLDCPVADL